MSVGIMEQQVVLHRLRDRERNLGAPGAVKVGNGPPAMDALQGRETFPDMSERNQRRWLHHLIKMLDSIRGFASAPRIDRSTSRRSDCETARLTKEEGPATVS